MKALNNWMNGCNCWAARKRWIGYNKVGQNKSFESCMSENCRHLQSKRVASKKGCSKTYLDFHTMKMNYNLKYFVRKTYEDYMLPDFEKMTRSDSRKGVEESCMEAIVGVVKN